MLTIDEFIDSALGEGCLAAGGRDAEHYNFMCSANRLLRKAEARHGTELVPAILARLSDPPVGNPGVRVILGSLLRLIPTRQSLYESILSDILPGWRTVLEGNPQAPLPDEFRIASERVLRAPLDLPSGLVEAMVAVLGSKHIDVALTGLKACEKLGCRELIDACSALRASTLDERIRNAATLATARLSALDEQVNAAVIETVFDDAVGDQERISAFEAILIHGPTPAKDYLRDALSDKDFKSSGNLTILDAAMDSGRVGLGHVLENRLKELSFREMPDATLRRIVRTPELPVEFRREASRSIAREGVLDTRSRIGLLVHRNSIANSAWIGHAGIFVEEDFIVHCTAGYDPGAVHRLSFSDWKADLECWGAREDDDHPVDLSRAIDRALEVCSWRTEYDGLHNNQKGKWIKGWFCAPKYWESDCVGFTEHCYEYAGGDPTPNSHETGLGWPLTPREQRDRMRKVFDC